jgi:hypothetical protein
MEEKLKEIFKFLNENGKYNFTVQKGFYHACIVPYQKPSDKAKSLLFHILNTQSQPKIDKVAVFWQNILDNPAKLSSFNAFSKAININHEQKNETPFLSLFKALKKQPGWGDKTAALFIKAVYHTHNGKYKKFAFWKDVPELTKKDRLFLPVDSVITFIFIKLSNKKINSFASINNELKNIGYTGAKIEVWDDLWFWGFITQKVSSGNRSWGFNEAKYWAMPWSDKNPQTIKKIKSKANIFIKSVTRK